MSLLNQLFEEFGTMLMFQFNLQPIDYIMNKLSRFGVGLLLGKWKQGQPTLVHIHCKINRLRHPDEQFNKDEPDSEHVLCLSSFHHLQQKSKDFSLS